MTHREDLSAVAREWLPEELTNRGLKVAADPPGDSAAKPAATNGSPPEPAPAPAKPVPPPPKPAAAAPRPAATEKPSSFSAEEFERAVRDRVAALESRMESRLKKTLEDLRRTEQPDGGLGADVEGRLKQAELRVAEAVRATERRVLEVSQLVGALQAIRPENGSNGAEAGAAESRSIRPS